MKEMFEKIRLKATEHKTFLIYASGAVLLGLALALGNHFLLKKTLDVKNLSSFSTLKNKDRNLTEAQKKFYQDRIETGEGYLKTISPEEPNRANKNASGYVFLAQQYYGLGELGKAEDLYNKAMSEDSGYEQSYLGLAAVFEDVGDFHASKQILEKGLEKKPGFAALQLKYIEVRKTLGASVEEIEKLYQDALVKTGQAEDVLTQFASFEELNGKKTEAYELWKKALEKNPDNKVYREQAERLKP